MNIKRLFFTGKLPFKFTKTHRTISVPGVLATFVLALGTAMSGAPKFQDPASPSSGSSQHESGTTAGRTKQLIGSEAITITRHGFQPTDIRRTPGRFFLHVENRSGVNPLLLRVSTQSGNTVKEFSLTSDELDWADEVNLPEGQYMVTEINRGWTCRLTITSAP